MPPIEGGFPWLEPMLPHFPPIVDRLRAVVPAESEVYLVGGTVRDAFLSRRSHDIDVVVPREGLRLARRLADALGGAFYPLDAARGTGRVLLTAEEGRYTIDIATYRGASLEADLRARDFTINALAVPLHAPDRLHDPTGGLRDLKGKILRACSPATFADDPLRVLRGPRLAAALGFRIHPATRDQMQQAIPLLEDVSPERLRDELFRMLGSAKPTAPLKALDALGALSYVLPELPRLRGVRLPPPHQADAWQHATRTAEYLAALLEALAPAYDQEKAADFALGYAMVRIGRYRDRLAEHLARYSHPDRPLRALLTLAALYVPASAAVTGAVTPETSARLAERRGRALRLSNAETRRLHAAVAHARALQQMAAAGVPLSRRAIYRYYRSAGSAGVDAVLLSLAESMATYGPRLPHDLWQRQLETARALLSAWWEQHDEIVAPRPLLAGEEIMAVLGIPPGPRVGEAVEALREAQAAGEVSTRSEAERFLRGWWRQRA